MFKETLLNRSYPYFYRLLLSSIESLKHLFVKNKLEVFKFEIALSLLNVIGYVGIIWLLVVNRTNGSISVGQFAAIYYSIEKVTGMLNRLIKDLGSAMVNIASTTFLIDFIDEKESSKTKKSWIRKLIYT